MASTITIEDVCQVLDQANEVVKMALEYSEQNGASKESGAQSATSEAASGQDTSGAIYLDKVALDQTLDELERYNIVDEEARQKIATEVLNNPNNLLPILTKVARLSAPPHSEGKGIPKQSSAADSSEDDDADPDGWGALASGRPVKLKR